MRRFLSLLLLVPIGGATSAAHASPADELFPSTTITSEHFTAVTRIGPLTSSSTAQSSSYELTAQISSPVAYESIGEAHAGLVVRGSPNPFSSSVIVTFDLPAAMRVKVGLFDVTGREVATIADGHFTSGRHDVPFLARSVQNGALPNGIYFLRTIAGEFTVTQRVALIQ